MDRDKLIQRLRATFLAELKEYVRVFNRELLTLEQSPSGPSSAESIRTLFRVVHSMKGAARSVNATRLEGVCHRLEEELAAVRDGRRPLTAELITVMFGAVDTFEATGREFESSEQGSPPAPGTPPGPAQMAPGAPAAPARAPARMQPIAMSIAPPPESANRTSLPPPGQASSLPPPAAKGDQPLTAADRREPLDPDSLVRVPGRKLDGLLAQSGELLIARRRFDTRRSELGALQELVAGMQLEWRGADAYLKRSLVARERKNGHAVQQLHWNGSAVPRKVADALHATREHLNRLEREIDRLSASVTDDIRTLERTAGAVEQQIHKVRMLPFSQACEGLFRAVRDLARSQNKDVELVLEGGEVELDRALIDALRDPLLHLVRNSIDHGIEPTAVRAAQGKPARARVFVSASLGMEQVQVEVSDDGRGIDPERVRDAARRRALPPALLELDPLRLIFEPGFSTASEVSEVSGRGVGLDVVKTQIETMRGSVEVSSVVGQGCQFNITLPLTVTTLRVLFVRVGAEVFALPSTSVRQLVRAGADKIGMIEGREVLLLGAAPIPIVQLGELLGSPVAAAPAADAKLPLVIAHQQNQLVAFAVDELVSELDVVCKPLGKRVGRLPYVSAATILPTGRVALLLKPSDLIRVGKSRAPARRTGAGQLLEPTRARKRVLLVDDSATIRTLESSILEAAGHDVLVAVDGSQAWQLLQDKGADLVVSDVEMPNMDGFALTQLIRTSRRFRDLPVILLTSLDSAADRARGMESGASAYLVKSAFDQTNLLETIRQLL